jgi:hypothetical protein
MPPPKRLIHDDRIRSATPRDTWNSSISGLSRCRDMAQTRRMGMQNDWTELREAPRFSLPEGGGADSDTSLARP